MSTKTRGFASMTAEQRREIASVGGKAAHVAGTAHEFTPEEAVNAGRQGGLKVSQDREHMRAIGRAGGKARGRNAKARAAQLEGGALPASEEAP